MAQPLWSRLDLNRFPGEASIGRKLASKSMADQARAEGYQDLYRNIQAMREAAFAREVKRGEFPKEFAGFVDEFAGFDLPVIGSVDVKSMLIGAAILLAVLKFGMGVKIPATAARKSKKSKRRR